VAQLFRPKTRRRDEKAACKQFHKTLKYFKSRKHFEENYNLDNKVEAKLRLTREAKKEALRKKLEERKE